MHVVFLNQYYPPDAAPTGVMLRAVAEECARQGHEVTVICAAGGYAEGRRVKGLKVEGQKSEDGERSGASACPGEASEGGSSISHSSSNNSSSTDLRLSDLKTFDSSSNPLSTSSSASASSPPTINPQRSTSSIRVLRLPATRFGRGTFVGKLLDYASYYLGVAWRLGTMNPPPDRIVALTTPPYLSVLARAVSKLRGADHAHWVMDLYPDVMVAHGMLVGGGWKHRLLAGLARWGFGGRRCAAVLTLGPDMAERCGRVIGGQLAVGSGGEWKPGADARPPTANCQPPTANRQPPTVSWVSLWGGETVGGRRLAVGGWQLAEGAEEEELAVGGGERKCGAQARPPTANRTPPTDSLRAHRGWAEDELVVMYSGNMGLGHRFGEVLEVVLGETSEGLKVGGQRSEEFTAKAQRSRRDAEEIRSENQNSTINNHQTCPGVAAGEDGSSIPPSSPESEGLKVGGQRSEEVSRGAAASPTTDNRQPTTLPTPRFVFYGGGRRRGEIEAFMAAHPDAPVELHDYAPAEELSAHLMTADVHLVSLEPAWTGTMVPSKLQGIFAVGRPVVFVGAAESSIGRWVAESGGGWVVAAGDVAGLRAAIDEARDPEVRKTRGEAAGRFARENFDRVTNVRRVVEGLVGKS